MYGLSREFVDEPRLGHGLHPRAHQGNKLSAEEQLKVSVPKRPARGLPVQLAFGRLPVVGRGRILNRRSGIRHCHSLDDPAALCTSGIFSTRTGSECLTFPPRGLYLRGNTDSRISTTTTGKGSASADPGHVTNFELLLAGNLR